MSQFVSMYRCKIPSSYSPEPQTCKLKSRPSVVRLQLRLFCLFAINLVISSWCLTRPAFRTWNRFIRKKLGREVKGEDVKHPKPKHRVIADAYSRRHHDEIAVSMQKYHTDPVPINFDMNNMNSTESGGIGATLTRYMYNMIGRRNAVANVDFYAQEVNYKYNGEIDGSESEMSVTVTQRQYSYAKQESRRSSVESHTSVRMAETEIKFESHSKKQKESQKPEKRKCRKVRMPSNRNRRASSSSVESQRITNQEIEYRYLNRAILRNAMIMPPDEMTSMFSQDAQPSNMLAAFDGSHSNALVNFLRNNNDEAPPSRLIVEPLTSRLNELDDTTSLSSSAENAVPLDENNSFDSGQLDSRNKMPLQNSKDSCDVGTQANAYDLVPHDKDLSLEKHQPNHENLYETTEMHQLLSNREIFPRQGTLYMTVSERNKKIKELLLPKSMSLEPAT